MQLGERLVDEGKLEFVVENWRINYILEDKLGFESHIRANHMHALSRITRGKNLDEQNIFSQFSQFQYH